MERYYKNIGAYFLVLLVFVALGFYYPYFSLFPSFPSVTAMIHVHTLSLLAWVSIMIVQPLLIRYKKFRAHRIIGKLSYFIVPLVVITCLGVMRQQYEEGIEHKLSAGQSLKTVFTSFTGVVTILIYYILAVTAIHKGNVGSHMRYMICLFLEFIPPTLGRTLGYWLDMRQVYTHSIAVGIGAVIIVFLLIADRRRKADYTPYIVALWVYVVCTLSWALLGFPL